MYHSCVQVQKEALRIIDILKAMEQAVNLRNDFVDKLAAYHQNALVKWGNHPYPGSDEAYNTSTPILSPITPLPLSQLPAFTQLAEAIHRSNKQARTSDYVSE